MNKLFQTLPTNISLSLLFLSLKHNLTTNDIIAVIILHVTTTTILTIFPINSRICKIAKLVCMILYITLATYVSLTYISHDTISDIIILILHILFNIIHPICMIYKTSHLNKKTFKNIPIKEINKCFKGRESIK